MDIEKAKTDIIEMCNRNKMEIYLVETKEWYVEVTTINAPQTEELIPISFRIMVFTTDDYFSVRITYKCRDNDKYHTSLKKWKKMENMEKYLIKWFNPMI